MAVPQDDVRHLLARTGFGVPTAGEASAFAALSYPQAVNKVLNDTRGKAVSDAPAWLDTIPVTVPATMSQRGLKRGTMNGPAQMVSNTASGGPKADCVTQLTVAAATLPLPSSAVRM